MSLSQNPWPEPEIKPEEAIRSAQEPVEDPIWSGWDLLQLIGLTLVVLIVVPLAVVVAAHFLFYKLTSLTDIARIPEVVIVAQLLVYAVVLLLMRWIVEMRGGSFWRDVRWNWPSSWGRFLFIGVMLYVVLVGLGQFLPIPKHLPIDRFFQTAREATLMSVLAITLAPFMEELFFRGFLYPVLARRIGITGAILLTGTLFGLLHGAQLGYSWAVLIIFLVGIALTVVRAKTKSVGASFLVHVGYNGTLSVLLFIASSGFRHLERLTQ